MLYPTIERPKSFDADQYVEIVKETCTEKGRHIGAVAFVAKGAEIYALSPEQAEEVFKIIYEKYIHHARIPLSFGEDKSDSILRVAFENALPRQDIFDFVVCASLVSFNRNGRDLVSSHEYLHEVAPDLVSATAIQDAFIALKEKVDAGELANPWVKDCVGIFKGSFSKWLDAQIIGIEGSIRRDHPHVRSVGIAAERPVPKTHSDNDLGVPGYR